MLPVIRGGGNPPGPNMVLLGSVQMSDESAFRLFLRKPASPMMPAFSAEQLPDADAKKLYDYLKTQAAAEPQ